MNRSPSSPFFKQTPILLWLTVAGVALLAAWARWRHMQSGVYHIDEFISMLSIRMILEKGRPILPSGLYYDHGLAFSYVGALFAGLGNGNLMAARWWSLTSGVLATVLIYITAWRLFNSHWWGLVAALALAIDADAVQWGGRVRMYSQANLLFIGWILFAWLGSWGGGYRWARWVFIGLVWAGLSTHLVLILALPPLAVALALVWIIHNDYKISWSKFSRPVCVDLGLGVLVIVFAFWTNSRGFVASYTVDSTIPASETAAVNRAPADDVLAFALSADRWEEMNNYLNDGAMRRYAILALVGLAAAGIAWLRGHLTQEALAAIFISTILTSTLLGMLLFVADAWHQTRYYFLVIYPPLLLLAVYGVRTIYRGVVAFGRKLSFGRKVSRALLGGVIAFCLGFLWPLPPLWNSTVKAITGSTDTPNAYNEAVKFVNAHHSPGDQLVTVRPEAGYLFADMPGYYINHTSPVLIPGPTGWIDGYAGTPYLGNVADLHQALDRPGTLWFVIDERRLIYNLEPIFVQNILWHTEMVESTGNVLVLRETEPTTPRATSSASDPIAVLTTGSQLVDFSLAGVPLPGQTVELVTIWQNTRTLWLFKIFVHLRDSAGNTIAQADFTPLDQIDAPLREQMPARSSGEAVPLRTALTLPPELPPGVYELYIGVYHPEAFERIPVVDDVSGEHAIFLRSFEVD